MKEMLLVFALTLAFVPMAVAAEPVQEVMAPIQLYIDSFSKSDPDAAASAFSADASILDEVSPHVWHGPTALRDWAAAIRRDAAAYGVTDEHATIGKPIRTDVTGDVAYVVVPEVFFYKDHGKAMYERGTHVFSLRKESGAWKITSSAWAGGTWQAMPKDGAMPKP